MNKRFSNQWRLLRRQQLFQEDIRSLKQVQDITHMEMLATLLRNQSGAQVNYSNLAKLIKVSVDTVTRWLSILEQFYYCFRLQPWHKNVIRSIIKEPKIYVYDWTEVNDPGARIETLVACHLQKAVSFWNDYGFGEFSLHYLRDKEKREVDFLVVKDEQPWLLVEVKSSEANSINKNLYYFQKVLNVPHAFQVALDKPYIDLDCFAFDEPVIVPLLTFLSQLV